MNKLEQNPKLNVIVIDDDDLDIMAIKRAFKTCYFVDHIYTASDGKQGLSLLANQKFDKSFIVLLDVNMPRMNGLEMLKHLRSDPKVADSIVFVLSTSTIEEDINEAYKNNISGYIVKSNLDIGFKSLKQFVEQYWRLIALPV